jgi:hypothetical protein
VTPALSWAIGIVLLFSPLARAELDPRPIAHRYAKGGQLPPPWDYMRGRPRLTPSYRPAQPWIEAEREPLLEPVAEADFDLAPTPAERLARAKAILAVRADSIDGGGILDQLRRWQRSLSLRVGAHRRTTRGGERWEGLAETDIGDDLGRTFSAAGGRVLGDLSLLVGNVGSAASFDQVAAGEAGLLALNPFREVGAQIDITILENPVFLPGSPVIVLRLRAAYIGLFEKLGGVGDSAGVAAESELGVALALKW